MIEISDADIENALKRACGIRDVAARELGISSRTLRRRIAAAGIEYEPEQGPHEERAEELDRYLTRLLPHQLSLTRRDAAGEWGHFWPSQKLELMTAEESAAFRKFKSQRPRR